MAQLRKIKHQGGAVAKGSGKLGTPTAKPLANTLVPVDKQVSCAGCKRFIKAKDQKVQYNAQSYHVKCFKCSKCRHNLGGVKVFADTDVLYCETCYINIYERCAKCKGELTDEMVQLSDKVRLHRACFKCSVCSTLLESLYVELEAGNTLFCHQCFKSAMPKCAKCKCVFPVLDGRTVVVIEIDGQSYHPECLICDKCSGSLDAPAEEESVPGSLTPTVTRNTAAPPAKQAQAQSNSAKTGGLTKVYFPIEGKKLCKKCAELWVAQTTNEPKIN